MRPRSLGEHLDGEDGCGDAGVGPGPDDDVGAGCVDDEAGIARDLEDPVEVHAHPKRVRSSLLEQSAQRER